MSVLSERDQELIKSRLGKAGLIDIPVAVNPETLAAEAKQREEDQKMAEQRIPALFAFIRQMASDTQAMRDTCAKQLAQYKSVLSQILSDKSAENITRRRVAVREFMLDVFGVSYISFEEVVDMLDSLADPKKGGYLVKVSVPVGVKPKDCEEVQLYQYCRTGLHAYAMATDLHFEEADIKRIKVAFDMLYKRTEGKVIDYWGKMAQAMQYKGVITLQEMLEGKTGPMCCFVPPDPKKGFEGGWALWDVSPNKDGATIELKEVVGDPVECKGHRFVNAMTNALLLLSPKIYLTVKQLKYPMAFHKDPNTKQFLLNEFFSSHPEHRDARVLMHATLMRALRLAKEQGKLTHDLVWLRERPRPVVTTPEGAKPEQKPAADNGEEAIPEGVDHDPKKIGVEHRPVAKKDQKPARKPRKGAAAVAS